MENALVAVTEEDAVVGEQEGGESLEGAGGVVVNFDDGCGKVGDGLEIFLRGSQGER